MKRKFVKNLAYLQVALKVRGLWRKSRCNGSKRFGQGEVEGSCTKRSDGNICESGDYLKGVCA